MLSEEIKAKLGHNKQFCHILRQDFVIRQRLNNRWNRVSIIKGYSLVDVWFPYGKTEVCVRVPTRNYLGTIEPKEKKVVADVYAEVERSLRNPIGTKQLTEIAKLESKVAIVVDDATRSSPTNLMITPLLAELKVAGVRDENVTIIFACGVHRPVTHEEATGILGEGIINRIKTVSHDCRAQDLVFVGTTNRHQNKIYLNRFFTEADVKILTGDVCFHYYAGYGGGRKSVLPGVAGEESVKHNHALLLDDKAKTGMLEQNPVNEDMIEAAHLAKVDFVLNVVTNTRGEIVRSFAGSVDDVFLEGTKLVDEMYRVSVDRKADVVVVSSGGYPADIDLYQSFKAVDSVLDIIKRGGVIVLIAECSEGHGNQAFYDWMFRFKDANSAEKEIKRNFVLGGHKAYYLMEALQKVRIILVSSMPDYYAASIFRLKTARGVNEALDQAFDLAGANAKVWAVPFGNFTLPELKVQTEQVT
jgi:nickel-dependent lactate racemase